MGIKEPSWRKLYNGQWGVVLYDNNQHAKGDTTQVTARDGTRQTVTLDRLVTSGIDWQLWSVQSLQTQIDAKLAQLSKPAPKAVPPTVRRQGTQLATQPEPPPHTDADAPPPRDALRWPSGEEPSGRRVLAARMRFDEHGCIDGPDPDSDEADAFYDAYLADAGDR